MKLALPAAALVVGVLLLAGCSDDVPSATAEATVVADGAPNGPTTPAAPSTSSPAATTQPAATLEEELAALYAGTVLEMLDVAPAWARTTAALAEHLETEGQRRWEAEGTGIAFDPGYGHTMFSEDELADLVAQWHGDDAAVLDRLSFASWSETEHLDLATGGMLRLASLARADAHRYEIDVPTSAVERGVDDTSLTLDTAQVTVTRDGQPVVVDFGNYALMFFTLEEGEWRIVVEQDGILFPFESLGI